MGACTCVEANLDSSISINISEFDVKYPIGRGGFGRVWKIMHKPTSTLFAMKEMRKDLIVSKHSVPTIMNERHLLGILRHPFIVNLHYAFQNIEFIYLVIDMMSGGDFRYYLIKNKDLSEPQIQFIAACIVTSIEYLHSNNITHRDIKPENLVFDRNGYLHLTDFGIARLTSSDNSGCSSGTPGYMAPEVICGQDHGGPVDYFALGVIIFECITHSRPYIGKTRKVIRDQVLARQVTLKFEGECNWTHSIIDFVNRLIQRKPENRLGFHGVQEVKSHSFFEGFEWDKLMRKEMDSPFKFENEDNFDYDHVMGNWGDINVKVSNLNSQKLFAGFFYDERIFSKRLEVNNDASQI